MKTGLTAKVKSGASWVSEAIYQDALKLVSLRHYAKVHIANFTSHMIVVNQDYAAALVQIKK